MPQVDNLTVRCVGPDQERRDLLHRPLCRREADTRRARLAYVVEARQRQPEVAASFVAGQSVDFVHDYRFNLTEGLPAALRCQHQIQRLRRRDQDMGWRLDEGLAIFLRRVASAQSDRDLRPGNVQLARHVRQLLERRLQVALDVVAQRLERRDVDDLRRRLVQRPGFGLTRQRVDAAQERRQRLARPGRRRDQDVTAAADLGPAGGLRVGRGSEAPSEPRFDNRMKRRNDVPGATGSLLATRRGHAYLRFETERVYDMIPLTSAPRQPPS